MNYLIRYDSQKSGKISRLMIVAKIKMDTHVLSNQAIGYSKNK